MKTFKRLLGVILILLLLYGMIYGSEPNISFSEATVCVIIISIAGGLSVLFIRILFWCFD